MSERLPDIYGRVLSAMDRGEWYSPEGVRSRTPWKPSRETFLARLSWLASRGFVERDGELWRVTDAGWEAAHPKLPARPAPRPLGLSHGSSCDRLLWSALSALTGAEREKIAADARHAAVDEFCRQTLLACASPFPEWEDGGGI